MLPTNSQDDRCFASRNVHCVQILKVRADIGAIVVKGAVPGKAGNVVEITPAKIVAR